MRHRRIFPAACCAGAAHLSVRLLASLLPGSAPPPPAPRTVRPSSLPPCLLMAAPPHRGRRAACLRGRPGSAAAPAVAGRPRHAVRRAPRVELTSGIHHPELYVEGLGPYAVTGALLTNAAMRLYLYTHVDRSETCRVYWAAYYLCIASSTLCMLCGTFSMMVFILMKLYGLTMLGMGKEHVFATFFDGTKAQRIYGFRCFLGSLYLLLLALASHLTITLRGRKGVAASMGVLAVTFAMHLQWRHILLLASRLIYGIEF